MQSFQKSMQKRLQLFFLYVNMSKIFSQYKSYKEKNMPNIKSAKKRVITSEKRNEINTAKRSRVKTAIKKYNAALEAGDIALAEKLLPETVSIIDRAYSDGIYKKNTVARKKATLCRALDRAKAAK